MKLTNSLKISLIFLASSFSASSAVFSQADISLSFWKNRESKIVNDHIKFTSEEFSIGGQDGETSSFEVQEALFYAVRQKPLVFDVKNLSEANKNWIMMKFVFDFMLKDRTQTLDEQIENVYSGLKLRYDTNWDNAKHDVPIWIDGLAMDRTVRNIQDNCSTIDKKFNAALSSEEHRLYIQKSFSNPLLQKNIKNIVKNFKKDWSDFQNQNELKPYAELITAPQNKAQFKEADKQKRARSIESIILYMLPLIDGKTIDRGAFWNKFLEYENVMDEFVGDKSSWTKQCLERFQTKDKKDIIEDFANYAKNEFSQQMKPENSYVQFVTDGPEMNQLAQAAMLQIQDEAKLPNFSKDKLFEIAQTNFFGAFHKQAEDVLVAYTFAQDLGLIGNFFWNAFPFEVHCSSSYGATFEAYIDQLDAENLMREKLQKKKQKEHEKAAAILEAQMESIVHSMFKYPNYFTLNVLNNYMNTYCLYLAVSEYESKNALFEKNNFQNDTAFELYSLQELSNMNAGMLYDLFQSKKKTLGLADADLIIVNSIFENNSRFQTLLRNETQKINRDSDFVKTFEYRGGSYNSTDRNILFPTTAMKFRIIPNAIQFELYNLGASNDLVMSTDHFDFQDAPIYCGHSEAMSRFFKKHIVYDDRSWK